VGNPEGGLNLWALDGVSAREIGRTLGVARSTIQDNLRRAHAIGIARPGYNQGQPLTFTWIGTATTTVLTGSNYGSNIFDLGPGGDTVTGGNTNLGGDGTNTVVFDKGVGHAIVDLNGGVGTMQIAADIATSDVILQADNNGNLTVISRRKRLRESQLAIRMLVAVRILTTVRQIAMAAETMTEFAVLMEIAEVFAYVSPAEGADVSAAKVTTAKVTTAKMAATETTSASECGSRERGSPENQSGSESNHFHSVTHFPHNYTPLTLGPPMIRGPERGSLCADIWALCRAAA
jgi:hypothetical protein